MVGGGSPGSPWTYVARDTNGLVISVSVNFNTSTQALINVGGVCATLHRDAGCKFTTVVIGIINQDGTLDPNVKTFDLSGFSGDRTFNANQMHARGFDTLSDVRSVQITAL